MKLRQARWIIVLLAWAAPPAFADFSAKDGVAARGYDVVAYFVDGAAVQGSDEFVAQHGGVSWFFSNVDNLNKFEASPEKYAPRFGGFCSLTTAHGAKIPGNPEAWAVHEGELYLFFHKPARETWLMNPKELIVRAEEQSAGL